MEIPSKITIPSLPDFPAFTFPEGWVCPSAISLPPIITGQPIISGPCPPPFEIKIQIPENLPPISINWSEPPQIRCVCLIRDPGCTDTEAKEKHDVPITTEEKCKAILQKIVELANEGKPIGFERDFGHWTATITKGKMHTHVGVPGKDGNFDILVNNLYDLLIKGEGLSWA